MGVITQKVILSRKHNIYSDPMSADPICPFPNALRSGHPHGPEGLEGRRDAGRAAGAAAALLGRGDRRRREARRGRGGRRADVGHALKGNQGGPKEVGLNIGQHEGLNM